MKKFFVFVLILGLLIVFCIWQNNSVTVSGYEYKSSKLPDSFDGYKIVQISDLHNKQFGKDNDKLISLIKKQEPDLIVITGDIVDSTTKDVSKAIGLAKNLSGIADVYYVTGNHEHRLPKDLYNELINGLNEYIVVLSSYARSLTIGKDEIHLMGLNDKDLNAESVNDISSEVKNTFKILLAHRPDYFETYAKTDIDLILCGHAHGGQIRLPFIGGLYAPGQGAFPKYTSGIYKKNDTTMILSRGLGNSIFPLRIFNRPDLVVITLEKE